MAEFIFSTISYFQHILLDIFRRIRLNYENCSFRGILFYTLNNIQPSYKKNIFLVVSRSDVHFGFEQPFFCVPDRRKKIGRLEINTRTKCKICSKSAIKTPQRGLLCPSSFFTVNFEQISNIALMLPLVTLHWGIDMENSEAATQNSGGALDS